MTLRHVWRYLSYFCLVGLVGLFIAGCVIQDPPALGEIAKARKALDDAKKAGAADRAPEQFAELEKRFLQTRGVFYACRDAEAARLAQALVADANALAAPPVAVAPPPPPANRPPVARLTVPAQSQTGESVPMDASASSDPDGDPLTYTWDFGDGTAPTRLTFPRTTHAYARAGNYTVKVTVEDGRGGTSSATAPITTVLRVVLQERGRGRVLFDFDKAEVKPEAKRQLAVVLQALKEQPALQTLIVGHTDSVGTDAYNLKLSQRRAEAVATYLVQQGVSRPTIKTDWKGESAPVASNATAEGRAQNRRVEITLTPPAR